MYNIFKVFCLSLLVRAVFLILQNPSPDILIEDELMYWKNATNYFENGYLKKSIMNERMLGVFIYYKTLLYLSMNNFKILLFLQSVIDALSCVIIYKIANKLFPKQSFFIFLSAALSPLMIIISAQILSETIFLFFFSLFLYFSIKAITQENRIYLNTISAAIFLGLSVSIRSIAYPLLFLSIIPYALILFNKKVLKYKIILLSIIFIFISFIPISPRIINNYNLYNTFSLTSQTGTHLAYWVTPMILTETKKINREEAINVVNKAKEKYRFTENPFETDTVLRKVSFEILSNINKFDIIYFWARGSIINLIAPSILLDKKIRSLPHPSFYEVGNLFSWVKLLIEDNQYHRYLIVILVASFTSIFTLISLLVGSVYIFKKSKTIFILTNLYILYFLIITGPVLSPKYVFPILPCIFMYQGITVSKFLDIIKKFKKK